MPEAEPGRTVVRHARRPAPGWQHDAACAGAPIAYFYSTSGRPDIRTAAAYCASCPVIRQCRAEELWRAGEDTSKIYGYRGGLTETDRRRVLTRLVRACRHH